MKAGGDSERLEPVLLEGGMAAVEEWLRAPINFMENVGRAHPHIAQWRLGLQRCYALNHPDLVREVLAVRHRDFNKGVSNAKLAMILGQGLITSDGEIHDRQRPILQPGFGPRHISAYSEVMLEASARFQERWTSGQEVDINQEMRLLALWIICRAIFDLEVDDAFARGIGEGLTLWLEAFRKSFHPSSLSHLLPDELSERLEPARKEMDEAIYALIDQRRREGAQGSDLLSTLIRGLDVPETSMSDEQLRDELMTLVLAGHETTSNALTFGWYLLARDPDEEAKLHKELDRVLGDRPVTVNDADRLPYSRAIFLEAMRLYPPVWLIDRRANKDTEVGGVPIPEGAIVLMPQWVIHRDPRFFDEPDEFRPARWLEEPTVKRPKYSYYPFGGGPRVCLGEPFAMAEGVLVLTSIAQNWTMRPTTDEVPDLLPSIVLRPEGGMQMRLESRPAE